MDLDQQYLQFLAQTGPAFARYPQLEPLRYLIFRELSERRAVGWKAHAKDLLRPLVRRSTTRGPLHPADVLIWVEGSRRETSDASLAIYRELAARGVAVKLVSYGGPEGMPTSAAEFRFPASAIAPKWAEGAWFNLADTLGSRLSSRFRQSFLFGCATVENQQREMLRVLDAVKPSVVLISSTQQSGGAALAVAARTRGIRTLLLQHGIAQPFYLPIMTDCMLTWGESSNQTLLGLGVPGDILITAGSPRHDFMAPAVDGGGKASLLRSLTLPERPTFVFFSNGNDLQRNGQAPRECAKWLEATAARYKDDLNIIVRLHPNEDGSLYKDCLHLRITKESPNLHRLLDGCDWTGSLCSTVLYEGLLYDKPVWQFYGDGWPDLANNWREGLAVRISSQDVLNQMVESMMNEGAQGLNYQELCSRVFANRGRAIQVVADLVQSESERFKPPFHRAGWKGMAAAQPTQ